MRERETREIEIERIQRRRQAAGIQSFREVFTESGAPKRWREINGSAQNNWYTDSNG
jgi:hypothetical protein